MVSLARTDEAQRAFESVMWKALGVSCRISWDLLYDTDQMCLIAQFPALTVRHTVDRTTTIRDPRPALSGFVSAIFHAAPATMAADRDF